MPRVLITDSIDASCLALLEGAGIEAVVGTDWSRDELLKRCADVDGWIIRSGTRIDDDLMAAARRLTVIGRAGVGVDNVDLESATRRGILVLNAPQGNTVSTAEHTVAMLMALLRHIAPANASLRGGRWERKRFIGTELVGKTVGIVGVGKIGRSVAAMLSGFGVRLLGFDPILSEEAAGRIGLRLVSLESLMAESDIVTVHTPLSDATRGLIGRTAFSICRPGLFVVNCARGGIVDEEALFEALESGTVAGAALDVYTREPAPGDSTILQALITHPRVLTTPHIAASTGEAQEKVARQVTEEVIHALTGGPVVTAVNADAVRIASRPESAPFMELARLLGTAAAQLVEPRSTGARLRVLVKCCGDIPRAHADGLRTSALSGFLGSLLSDPVNLVNASMLATESGLASDIETADPPAGYSALVEVVVSGAGSACSVSGTVFAPADPRITAMDGFAMELQPKGVMLLYRNDDRPGMLAAVGSILADASVNIASMALGRRAPGEKALTVICVDGEISEPILQRISDLNGVQGVKIVIFGS